MSVFNIVLAPGDGIGPEVCEEAMKVLHAIEHLYNHQFKMNEVLVGGASIDKNGSALTGEVLAEANSSSAVLFGAVGGPKWDDPRASVRPEQAILGLRKGLGLFANLRPVRVNPIMFEESALKREVLEGTDLLVVRELTGGVYFGRPQKRWTNSRGRQAVDTVRYSEKEFERILRVGFDLARSRRGKITSVDKANILETSRLWREIAIEVAEDYPDVEVEHLLVDACAMHLIRRPADFDVIVTENLFGDILTDEASMLAGSMGMLPSASLGKRRKDGTGLGLYEPIHGTAPDIVGQGLANPLAMILSVALMMRYSFGLENEAVAIELAVEKVIADGYRTQDIAGGAESETVSTSRMGTLVKEIVAKT